MSRNPNPEYGIWIKAMYRLQHSWQRSPADSPNIKKRRNPRATPGSRHYAAAWLAGVREDYPRARMRVIVPGHMWYIKVGVQTGWYIMRKTRSPLISKRQR